MSNMTTVFIAILGITLACLVLLMGKHALLSQDTFLRLYIKLQKTAQFGTKPFDVDYFGGPSKLRLLGVGLVAIGLFMIRSFFAISFSHFR
jgi:hypothetical protein